MLILSRKAGDAILIGVDLRVVVPACDGGGFRLGIDAPAAISILRAEIVTDVTDQHVPAGATPDAVSFLERLDVSRQPSPDEDGPDDQDPSEVS